LYAFQETGVWMGRVPGMHPHHVHYPEFLDLIDIPDKLSGTLCIKQEYSDLIIRAKDRSIRAGQWKLIYIPTTQGIIYELFNTHSDPGCKKECSSANPAVLTDLKEKLDAWIYSDPLMSKTVSK